MLKRSFEFEVLVNGHSVKEYYHNGSTYIEGKEGSRFSLRMSNNTNKRALFVPTVDGLSILNGKEASFNSRGYIVEGNDSTTISGWRTSDDKVAEFFFSSPKVSYAKKIGRGGNLGVIGCVVFFEKEEKVKEIIHIIEREKSEPYIPQKPWRYYPYPYLPISYYSSTNGWTSVMNTASSTSVSNCLSQCDTNSASLGTGFGQEKESHVRTVEFDREDSPSATFTIYYNTRQALEEMGIEFKKMAYINPKAFPNEEGYCERPY